MRPGHGLDPELDNIWYCITNIVSGESGEDSLKYVGKDGGQDDGEYVRDDSGQDSGVDGREKVML